MSASPHASHRLTARAALPCAAGLLPGLLSQGALAAPPPTPYTAIRYIMVLQFENESYSATFGTGSPAIYLNSTLLPQGELVPNWFATGHVSLDNYIAQISGQGSTPSTNSDCIDAATISGGNLTGMYFSVAPGTDDPNNAAYPGQVDGDGCVFPAPHFASRKVAAERGARTIGDQLDEKFGQVTFTAHGIVTRPGPIRWREYAEDMGNTPSRDNGDPDPLGGTDCAHPVLGGADNTNAATASDQYATRHNGFMYFHSVIDNQARCDAHVVPLGTVSVGTGAGGTDVFSGHLYQDLQSVATTPKFMFVTPNLCDDGHDSPCKGVNTEGTHVGGLGGVDVFLKHWMPMIFSSPAYQSGRMLVVLSFDEAAVTTTTACNASIPEDTGICTYPTGPNISNFGYSPLLGYYGLQVPPTKTGEYQAGGQTGAVLFNKRFISAGSVNSNGQDNHFSALRSYEDLLHIKKRGDDNLGHLGYAASSNLAYASFGLDVFNQR